MGHSHTVPTSVPLEIVACLACLACVICVNNRTVQDATPAHPCPRMTALDPSYTCHCCARCTAHCDRVA